MSPEDRNRADLLAHYEGLIERALLLAESLRREVDLADVGVDRDTVLVQMAELRKLVAANEEKATLIRSNLGT